MMLKQNKRNFNLSPWIWKIVPALVLLAGFTIRMLDMTDIPLDFHPTRQLYSAIKARS
jgi:hypothetical protein